MPNNEYLSDQIDDVLVLITETLGAGDYLNLASTSSIILNRLNPKIVDGSSSHSITLTNRYQHATTLLQQLLSHAALGEWEQAEVIYRNNPSLLSCRGRVYHPNQIRIPGNDPIDVPFEHNPGRDEFVNCTAWQIALMNEEYEEAELMGSLMTFEEKQKQFMEIFPDGQMVKTNFDSNKAKALVQAVVDAVIQDEQHLDKDDMSDATRQALHQLYAYAKPNTAHKAGLVFDTALYLEALQTYFRNSRAFKNIQNKHDFWSIRIEEWLAACLGTRFLRIHAAQRPSLYGFPERVRSLRSGCFLFDGSSYFDYSRGGPFVPGYNYYISSVVGRRGSLFKLPHHPPTNNRPPTFYDRSSHRDNAIVSLYNSTIKTRERLVNQYATQAQASAFKEYIESQSLVFSFIKKPQLTPMPPVPSSINRSMGRPG